MPKAEQDLTTSRRPVLVGVADRDRSVRLESQVCDLVKLAEIAENLVCGCADDTETELAVCIVQVLRDKIREFKDDYLAPCHARGVR